MSLSIGIVGLPNVGKSTLFNALTKQQNAEAANYPFCTIEPNKAIVPVPDARLDKLAELVKPQRVLGATVEFTDIAGLVKGASKGEGLGNQFLANIRETSAILHVVRCFEDDDIVHVDGTVDPLRDIEVIETELLLADVEQLEKRFDKLKKQLKSQKGSDAKLAEVGALLEHMNSGEPAGSFGARDTEMLRGLYAEMNFLSAKPVIYCCNVDEESIGQDNAHVQTVRELAASRGRDVVKISARMEEELVSLDDAERAEYMEGYGIEEPGLDAIIRTGFHTLGLASYFTAGEKEVRAWTIPVGATAPQSAGVIHTDFERGFIRAEVIGYNDYVACGSEQACRAKGKLRAEGKEYIVQDGDVIHFLFNV